MQKDQKSQQILEQQSNKSDIEEEIVYGYDSQEKQELYICPEQQNENQLCPKSSKTDYLNKKTRSISQQSLTNPQTKKNRSVFHNFQKHLVITLRQLIKIKKPSNQNEVQHLTFELWLNFTQQTKIYTKNILQFVFGVMDFETGRLSNVYDEKIVKKFGFEKIFAQYSEETICQAQEIIRKEVIKQMQEADLNSLLKGRRIGPSDKFEKYVKEFVSELEEGPIRKRLPKIKKFEMGLMKKSTSLESKM